MSKKFVTVVILVLAVICFLCLCCFGLLFAGFGVIMADAKDVSSTVVVEVCEATNNLSKEKYEEFFDTDEFTYEEAKLALRAVFTDEDCNDFSLGSFLDMFQKGISFSTENNNGERTSSFTFTNSADEKILINLEKQGDDWKIVGISVE